VGTKTSNASEVEIKIILQPLNGRPTLVGQNFDERRTGAFTRTLRNVVVKHITTAKYAEINLNEVANKNIHFWTNEPVSDAIVSLGRGSGTVDSRSGFCGVTAQESAFVDNNDIASSLKNGVRCRETSETSAHYDYVRHVAGVASEVF